MTAHIQYMRDVSSIVYISGFDRRPRRIDEYPENDANVLHLTILALDDMIQGLDILRDQVKEQYREVSVCACGHAMNQHTKQGCIWEERRNGEWWKCPCKKSYAELKGVMT
jgi:hypothetical protein